MRPALRYASLCALPLLMVTPENTEAGNLFGGKNSIFNNPGQIAGGRNSVINNPGQITGGPNSIINNPGQITGGPNSIINNPGQITQGAADALNELQASLLTGPTLERAIIESRNTAINGSMVIPSNIRQMLTGYASEASMNKARYKVGDNGFFNLARLLEQGGAAGAVTLIDVIVFRGPSEAADPAIWAHELTHVDQYTAWGAHSFAVQYARQWQRVEGPAYAKGNGFLAWYQQRQSGYNQSGGLGFRPQQLGAFCFAAGNRFGPGPVQPQGAPCIVSLPQGSFQGQIVP